MDPAMLEGENIYQAHYRAFQAPSAATSRSLQRVVAQAEAYRRTGRWLDIGFGGGELLSVVAASGWAPHGTEIAASALGLGAANGWVVAADPHADPRFPAGGFDVVSLVEVLEHVADPGRLLDLAGKFLRRGGLLFATTPNGRSLNRRLLGVRWSIFSAPEHVVIWTASALDQALTRRGFRVLRIRAQGLNPVELRRRLQPSRAHELPRRNEAAFALNESFSKNPSRRWVKDRINDLLSFSMLGDDLKVFAVLERPQ